MHVGKMQPALAGYLLRRVQGKSEEHQPEHARQRWWGWRLRCNSAAERSAAGDERHVWHQARGFGDCRANRRVRDTRRIGPPSTSFHGGKLVAERREMALGETGGERFH